MSALNIEVYGKADIRNPLSPLAHEHSRFANCQWERRQTTGYSVMRRRLRATNQLKSRKVKNTFDYRMYFF